ncbi:flagellar hook-basal body complex protein [Pseudomonas sp. NA-150]|uniref:flagellar hook-basal body complex protein n=1 Tax=Pseudomonas sp. NA-150 TaxID=3367525 RepID=UPI0037CB7152
MSFNTALNGLNAAHKRLEITSQNIANVGTHGYKSSRGEFAAIYAGTKVGSGQHAVGSGVRLANVTQNFSQGEVSSNTGRPLDFQIHGNGFFMVSDNSGLSYTRAGAFLKDKNDFVVDNQGSRLQGYGIDARGNVINGLRTDLKIDTSSMASKVTSTITETINLSASQPSLTALPVFDPNDPTTYSKVISRKIMDAGAEEVKEVKAKYFENSDKEKKNEKEALRVKGREAIPPAEHELKQYFVKTEDNQWSMYTLIDGRHPLNPASSSPLKATVTQRENGGYSVAEDSKAIQGAGEKAFSLEGWKPARLVDGMWTASLAGNGGQVMLSVSDGSVNGVDPADALMARTAPAFDPTNITTFSKTYSVQLYDSLGNMHELNQYFVKGDDNRWDLHLLVNGRNPVAPQSTAPLSASITFNPDGSLRSIVGSDQLTVRNNILTLNGWVPARVTDAGKFSEKWLSNGAQGSATGLALDFNALTQYNAATARSSAVQDGHAAGELSSISVDKDGFLRAGFSNSQSKNIGQVLLASFANEQGLKQDANNRWRETNASGMANIGSPSEGTLGSVVSGSLEGSNVKLTEELVDLIVTQTAYQANSKVLSTEATLMQTLIQAI